MLNYLVAMGLYTASLQTPSDIIPFLSEHPGSINTYVTQENIHSTICVKGWTAKIRPSTRYTNKIKTYEINKHNYVNKNISRYEADHIVPLSLGGHATDIKNIWPQYYFGKYGAYQKDGLERKYNNLVCSGKISLKDAQNMFLNNNWIELLKNKKQ